MAKENEKTQQLSTAHNERPAGCFLQARLAFSQRPLCRTPRPSQTDAQCSVWGGSKRLYTTRKTAALSVRGGPRRKTKRRVTIMYHGT